MSNVSVVITTTNRREMLESAVESVLRQSVATEIVLVDDGSTDGTSAMIGKRRWPRTTLITNASPRGIIAARNQAFAACGGEFIFTLDDDAVFGSDTLIEDILPDFQDAVVGAVAIPLENHIDGAVEILDRFPPCETRDFWCIPHFRGGANAIRRRAFLAAGGYSGIGREFEEQALCIKMLDQGFVVRATPNGLVRHFPTGTKGRLADRVLHICQNNIGFAWEHVPTTSLPYHLMGSVVNSFRLGIANGTLLSAITGLALALQQIPKGGYVRSPVSRVAYRAHRDLKAKGNMLFSDLASLMQTDGGRIHLGNNEHNIQQ